MTARPPGLFIAAFAPSSPTGSSIFKSVDTTSPQPGPLMLPVAASLPNIRPTSDEQQEQPIAASSAAGLPRALVEELWSSAGAKIIDLTVAEFGVALGRTGERHNFGQPAGVIADGEQQATFLRGLRLGDLALATACALGRDRAWGWFLETYRGPLTQAAIAITRSVTLGLELADSLYAELYGLRSSHANLASGSVRRSPLASYSGRGSLMGWLRTTLAQRHVDHHRRTHRETPLDNLDAPAPAPAFTPQASHLSHLKHGIIRSLRSLSPENRFLLSAYFLDQRTLLEISRLLQVHEATISRRIKRLSHDLREDLLQNLKAGGLSEQAAKEALGTDPRDVEINLRWLLQTSQTSPFLEESAAEVEPDTAESGQS